MLPLKGLLAASIFTLLTSLASADSIQDSNLSAPTNVYQPDSSVGIIQSAPHR